MLLINLYYLQAAQFANRCIKIGHQVPSHCYTSFAYFRFEFFFCAYHHLDYRNRYIYLFIYYLLCHINPGVPHQCAALFSLGLLHYMHDKTNINQHTFSYNTVTTLTTWYIHLKVVGFLLSEISRRGARNFFSYACSGQQQFSTVSFSGFGLWVRVRVLGSDNHKRFPNSNPNLNHNSNRNITLTPILTPNSSRS